MAAAISRLGRVGPVFRFAPGRGSGRGVLGGISVILVAVPVPLLAVPGLGLTSAGTFLAFARISRLSRRALLRRRLPRLVFQSGIIFLCEEAVRLPD